MRRVDLRSKGQTGSLEEHVNQMAREINEASAERPEIEVPSAFAFTNFDPDADETTSVDISTATTSDLAKAFATLCTALSRQGFRRTR